jgi:hypothetical protein
MMDWLGKLCGLPDKFISAAASSSSSADQAAAATSAANGSSSSNGTAAAAAKSGGGVIQGTSSEAVLVAMLAGRARALQGQPPEAALKLVAYGSDQVGFLYFYLCCYDRIEEVLRPCSFCCYDNFAIQHALQGQLPEAALKLVAYGSDQVGFLYFYLCCYDRIKEVLRPCSFCCYDNFAIQHALQGQLSEAALKLVAYDSDQVGVLAV